MYRPVKIIISICILLLFPFLSSAQTRTVSGVVSDNDGNPLPGAGVLIKEIPGKGVSTGVDGRFRIEIPSDGLTLVFSSLGMQSVEYAVPRNVKGDVEITLSYEDTFLDQVVVTGYAQTTVKRITGSVGIVSCSARQSAASAGWRASA